MPTLLSMSSYLNNWDPLSHVQEQIRSFAVRPIDEDVRLKAVLSYCILDTPGERVFDELTSLAAYQFGVPVALISIMGDDYKFVKSAVGTTVTRIERDLSFCSYCILENEVMVIGDARRDARFLHNPLVTGETRIRFYAGAPLITKQGVRIGTFCILGKNPRHDFDHESRQALQRFAYIASELIEHRILPQALERAEQQNAVLEQRTREEMAASRAKTDFLNTISHEIRTPMNGILGMLQLLISTRLDAEQLHYAEVAQSSGSTLLGLIDDLLDLSKIEAGKTTIEALPFNLSRTLQDVVEMWRIQSEVKGLHFALNMSSSVPESLIGDPARLRQVMNNLISNAVKFTSHGGITVAVEAFSEVAATTLVRFSISDTGIGMSAEQANALFQPFTQADTSTTRRYGGTGLGLFLSKRLVELMQGDIGIKSVVGCGSTFWFTVRFTKQPSGAHSLVPLANHPVVTDLRREAPSVDATTLPSRILHPIFTQTHMGSRVNHILVAEDNPTNQLVVKSQLTKLGYLCTLVKNGEEAVDVVGTQHFDAILMDCEMPTLDGYEATRRIRERGHKTIPIIAVTAHAMAGNREVCLSAGMNYYLSKPLDMGMLARTLETWCKDDSKARALDLTQEDTNATISTHSQIFHVEALMDRLMNDRALAQLVVQAFVDTCPNQLRALKHCVAKGDHAGIRLQAHALKGAAATVSAEYLSTLADRLEASSHKPAACAGLCEELSIAFQSFTNYLTASTWLVN